MNTHALVTMKLFLVQPMITLGRVDVQSYDLLSQYSVINEFLCVLTGWGPKPD